MHKSDSWIINRSQTVASIIAIYPWLIILITHIKYSLVPYNFTEDGLYLLVPTTVLSIINLTLSLITIGCMSVFTLLKPRRLKIYFCAMNTCYRFGYIFMLNSKLRCIFSKKSSKAPSRTGIIMEKKPNWLVRNIKKNHRRDFYLPLDIITFSNDEQWTGLCSPCRYRYGYSFIYRFIHR